MNYGIQLYSLRDEAEKNFENVFKSVSDMGYEFVETAGFWGASADTITEWLNKYSLEISSTHSGFRDLESDFAGTVKYHKAIGNTKYIIPCIDVSTRDALDEAVKKMNKFGPMLEDHGIELGYHNHHMEFIMNKDGIYPIVYFLEKTAVKFEIDTFWAFVADKNPVKELELLGNRLIGCIHLKDGLRYPKIIGTSLGDGAAPLREIIKKANDMNLKIIVESEGLFPTGIDEVKRCTDFLQNNKF